MCPLKSTPRKLTLPHVSEPVDLIVVRHVTPIFTGSISHLSTCRQERGILGTNRPDEPKRQQRLPVRKGGDGLETCYSGIMPASRDMRVTECQKNLFAEPFHTFPVGDDIFRHSNLSDVMTKGTFLFCLSDFFYRPVRKEKNKPFCLSFSFALPASYGPCAKRQMDSIMGREEGSLSEGKKGRKISASRLEANIEDRSQMPLWRFSISRLLTMTFQFEIQKAI